MAKKKTRVYISGRLPASEMLKVSKRALANAKRNKVGNTEVKRLEKLVTKYKKLSPKVIGESKKYAPPKAKTATKVFKKAAAKKTIGKSIAKKIPYVGAAIIARDVLKGVSKATCSKRGGKWTSGKCVGAKKAKYKPGAKVRDPISKR